tara:strand:+ start:2659 stop:3651 length:993 start_codon:yes stop_codon:yes gene_type:complete
MIKKSYEIKNLYKNFSYYLFYGKNNGAKKEEIEKIILANKNKSISKYDEKYVLGNSENFLTDIYSGSLFEIEKIIIINFATDKIIKIIEEIIDKKDLSLTIIIEADTLEKKSKLRNLFEKEKELICVAFYPDTHEKLSKIAYNYLKDKKVLLSQANINLIVDRSNGDRSLLKNELQKIEFYSKNKKVTSDAVLKLTNLSENFSMSELIDNCLAKNQKKTVLILNENRFGTEDCIQIIRMFSNKLKKILPLSRALKKNNNLEKTISEARPPIFWKDKDITKKQISIWKPNSIINLIYRLNQIELTVKKNINISINLVIDFMLEISTAETNN